jgi:hypothetical protein
VERKPRRITAVAKTVHPRLLDAPLAEQARNRDHDSSDECEQARKQHNVPRERRADRPRQRTFSAVLTTSASFLRKKMWLALAAITLTAAIGFNVLALAIQNER